MASSCFAALFLRDEIPNVFRSFMVDAKDANKLARNERRRLQYASMSSEDKSVLLAKQRAKYAARSANNLLYIVLLPLLMFAFLMRLLPLARILCYLFLRVNPFLPVFLVAYKFQLLLSPGVCQRLVELLLHPSPTVLVLALRTVGNIVTGDDAQTQFVIYNQVLPCLHQLLTQNHKKSIRKEACWTISNITAGNRAQIQAVIQVNTILPLVQLLQHAEFEIKKEAAWAISNATSGGSQEQIRFLANQGCIKPLCDLLICPDPRIITVCLEGLENILKVGEADKENGMNGGINIYAQMVDDCEGLDKIENLQSHDNNEIYEKAVKILEKYWAEEEEDQNLGDGVDGNQQGFSFGNDQPNVPAGGFNFS